MKNFKYSELSYNSAAYQALINDLNKYPESVFIFVSVKISDITRGNESLGNGSGFTNPNAILKYFVKYDDSISDLEIFNQSSFEIISDIDAWRLLNTLA